MVVLLSMAFAACDDGVTNEDPRAAETILSACGQPSAPVIDEEMVDLHEEFSFSPVGAMREHPASDDPAAVVNEMTFELEPLADAEPSPAGAKLTVACTKSCAGDECNPIGCLPLADGTGCSSCHCNDLNGGDCRPCACSATITATFD